MSSMFTSTGIDARLIREVLADRGRALTALAGERSVRIEIESPLDELDLARRDPVLAERRLHLLGGDRRRGIVGDLRRLPRSRSRS